MFENSTVCLLVNAKFFVPVAWLAWLPVGWLGWLCLGFLWLISEDDVIFRVDASFVNPVGFASYGLFTAGLCLVVGVVHLRRV